MALSWKCHWLRYILTQDDALKFTRIRIHIIMFKPPDSSIRVHFQDITEYLSIFMFITYITVVLIRIPVAHRGLESPVGFYTQGV